LSITYQALNPNGGFVGMARDDASGLVKFLEDHVLSLDDHSKFSVAVYRDSIAVPGKAMLEVQLSAEAFVQQYRSNERILN
jgi:hypothetical protein